MPPHSKRRAKATPAPPSTDAEVAQFSVLAWRTSETALQAAAIGAEAPLPKIEQAAGLNLRQLMYWVLSRGHRGPSVSDFEGAQSRLQAHHEAIKSLPAYQWLTAQTSFTKALEAAQLGDQILQRLRFIHVVAFSLAAYHIELHPQARLQSVNKRAISTTLSISRKLRGRIQQHPHLGDTLKLEEQLLEIELLLTIVKAERHRHDSTYPHRWYVRWLVSSFQHLFGDPMKDVVHKLCDLVGYSPDPPSFNAQLRSLRRHSK